MPLLGIDYSLARLIVLFLGLAVGLGLWIWLYRTRTGMVIRAGVDDRQMTSALGVNIQLTFAIAFVVGSSLAAFGGAVGASQGAVAAGQDGQWLLDSLVVVIIGGLGSLLGAAAGSLLYGLVFSFSGALPSDDRRQLLHPVLDRLHVACCSRSCSRSARRGSSGDLRDPRSKAAAERVIGVGGRLAVIAPLIFNAYWIDVILTRL